MDLQIKGTLTQRRHPSFPRLAALWQEYSLLTEDEVGAASARLREVAEELEAIYRADQRAPLPEGVAAGELRVTLEALTHPDGTEWREARPFRARFFPRSERLNLFDRPRHHVIDLAVRQLDRGDIDSARKAWVMVFGAQSERLRVLPDPQGGEAKLGVLTVSEYNLIARELGAPLVRAPAA